MCCIHGLNDISPEILKLAEKYRDDGVVGIDIAGDEASMGSGDIGLKFSAVEETVFNEARKLGIHRTVHAAEAGPAESVRQVTNVA